MCELDRDMYETVLCTKFHHNRISLSSVIVLTAGRTDILTDSRVYSLFEYTKKKHYYKNYRSSSFFSLFLLCYNKHTDKKLEELVAYEPKVVV